MFDLNSNDGITLNYPVDVNDIFGVKYEWVPENAGIGGVKHASVACCSIKELPLTAITESEYNNFAKMQVSTVGSTITVTTPEARGNVTFVQGEDTTTKTVNSDRQAILENASGLVKISSNVYADTIRLQVVIGES